MSKYQIKTKPLWQNLTQKQRLGAIIILLLFTIIIIYSIVTIIYRNGKISTTVKYAPYNATLTLNDSKISNNTTVWLIPGNYHLKVELAHFETIERDITIDSDHHYIVGVLTAIDAEGETFYNKHKEEFAETEGVIGRYLNEEGSIQKGKYPILNYLPINNALYSISYTYDEKNPEPIITVKADPEYIDAAVGKLKTFKNIDLTTYQIIFTTENPFQNYQTMSADTPLTAINYSINNIDNYYISEGQYIGDSYYLTKIYSYDYSMDYYYAHYYALLHKNNGKWELVATPQPILTTNNTPGVDKTILNSANSF